MGKLRYYTAFLGAETHHKATLEPLRVSLQHCMRAILGAFRSTPIPLLHAATRLPRIEDMIAADALKTVIMATSRDTLLGKDYHDWDGYGAKWTPLGYAQELLEHIPPSHQSVAVQLPVPHSALEAISAMEFIIPKTIDEAVTLHEKNSLLSHTHTELWTDGSFDVATQTGGAGFYLTLPDQEIWEGHYQVKPISSSYEAERAALLEGLEFLNSLPVANTSLGIYLDNQGLVRQLESLQFKEHAVDHVVYSIALQLEMLHDRRVSMRMTWIPGHKGIGYNPEADTLAGIGATGGPEIEVIHVVPPPSALKLKLRKLISQRLDDYLMHHVVPSEDPAAPIRTPFRGTIRKLAGNKTTVDHCYKWEPPDSRLFRARSGHSACPHHLARFNIKEDAQCPHCNHPDATLQHLLLECMGRPIPLELQEARSLYEELIGPRDLVPVNMALWTDQKAMRKILRLAERGGVPI